MSSSSLLRKSHIAAQSDPVILGSLCSLLDQLASWLRNSQSIEGQSYDTAIPSGPENSGSVPVLGSLKAAPNTYQQGRKISRHETRQQIVRKKRNLMLNLVGQSTNDLEFLPEAGDKGKTCSICRCPKHQRGSCPKIHKYKKPPLAMNKDMMSLHKLSTALLEVSRYKTKYRPTMDIREISSSTPNRMTGVVIHRRFFVNPKTRNHLYFNVAMSQRSVDRPTRRALEKARSN
jgi:hypothetical protein